MIISGLNSRFDYFGIRYYSSDLSVWLSVDPLADKYPSMSPYAYVYNNPINFIDLWGLEGKPNKYQRRYDRKKARFQRTGAVRHGRQLARYINRKGHKIGRSNATYHKGSNYVGFDVGCSNQTASFRKGKGPKNGGINISGPVVISGAVYGGGTQRENYGYYPGNTSSIITGAGLTTSLYGYAAQLAANDMHYIKYVYRGQNLLQQASGLSKVATGFSIAGGIIGVVDNTYQGYIDFSHGNYTRGSIQFAQAGAYGAGLGFIAFGGPPGVIIGSGIILVAGITDLVEYFIENK
jgi:hypothetical protein